MPGPLPDKKNKTKSEGDSGGSVNVSRQCVSVLIVLNLHLVVWS